MPYKCKEDNWVGRRPKEVIRHLEDSHNIRIIEPSPCITYYTKPPFSVVRFGIYLGREGRAEKWRINDYICDNDKTALPSFSLLLKHIWEAHNIKIFRFRRNSPVDPYEMLNQVSSKLLMSKETKELSKNLLEKFLHFPLFQGKHRGGVAALAVYVSCLKNDEKMNQEEIAEKFGIARVTLSKNYKIFRQIEHELDLG